MARLDHLGPAAKRVAQIGAAIGRDFSYGLLAAVARVSDGELQAALDQLTGSGLVTGRGVPPDATYRFKHAMIQDAAYDILLRGDRQVLHGRIASALEERYPETADTQPEVLAHHCTQAGLLEPAIEYSRRAGERAAQRSANLEAIAHVRKGLELVARLAEGPERTTRELALQVALGSALISVKGYAASATGQAYGRADELCQKLGDTPQRLPVLYGRYVYHEVRGEFAKSDALAEELLRLGEQRNDTDLLLIGHRIVGASAFYLGRFIPARAHLEQAMDLYDPRRHRSLALLYGYDARVVTQCYLVKTLFVLGHADQALALCRDALAEARQLAPGSLAFALNYASYLHHFRRERDAVRRRADELVLLSDVQAFPYWLAAGKLLRGWAISDEGHSDTGLAIMRDGLAGWRTTEAGLYMPYNLALLADAHAKAGRPGEALSFVAEALAWSQRTGERWFEAEQHRLKGELLRSHSGNEDEAGSCLQKALNMARAQSARSWELRAAMSLARLWRDQGNRDEAHALLAPVHGWFTEGFDTPDLKDATALLNELRG
jgi:predicted ATPase